MKQQYLKKSVALELDEKKCTGCGRCTDVCPHNVFALEDKKSRIVNHDSCMGCGACQKNCPVSAIKAESGVGCAYALILGAIKGSEPTCGCGGKKGCC